MELDKYAEHFLKLELIKANIQVFQNETGRKGVDFIIKTTFGNYHELHLKSFDLEKNQVIKILKEELREPKVNLWVAFVMITKNMDCSIYLIPSAYLLEPNKHSFIVTQADETPYWELNISVEVIPELSNYSLKNIAKSFRR